MNLDFKSHHFLVTDWVFDLMSKSYGIDILREDDFIIIDGIQVQRLEPNRLFIDRIFLQRTYSHEIHMPEKPLIHYENGQPDYISTIFYLVNCIQEFDQNKVKDTYDRYAFTSSLQNKFGCLETDLVKNYVFSFMKSLNKGYQIEDRPSRIFMTHDIDSVYGSLKFDGLWALKKGRFDLMLKVIFDTLLSQPPWFNIDKVGRLENKYDIKACYYWIVKNGRSRDGIKNGDYSINQKRIKQQKSYVEKLGNISGLHKSTMPGSTLAEERAKVEMSIHNRFHFLKMKVNRDWLELERSGIFTDSSLGYSNHMGFRNSFGLPFRPFSLEEKRTVDIVEIPLNVMDGMFNIQSEESSSKAFEQITNLYETNSSNAILTFLWHNSELTSYAYKWSFECYKRLLSYFYEADVKSILPDEILAKYSK